jgi:signal transduction histidine kinase
VFLGVGLICVLVQFGLSAAAIAAFLDQAPQAASLLASRLWFNLGIAVLLLLPLTMAAGILMTHRIMGPIYRFEKYLEALADGEDPGVCHTRDGDELSELRDAINRVADHVRSLRAIREDNEEDEASSLYATEEGLVS